MNCTAGSQIVCQPAWIGTQDAGGISPSCVNGSRLDTLRPEKLGSNSGQAAGLCARGCLDLRGMQPIDARMADMLNDIVSC